MLPKSRAEAPGKAPPGTEGLKRRSGYRPASVLPVFQVNASKNNKSLSIIFLGGETNGPMDCHCSSVCWGAPESLQRSRTQTGQPSPAQRAVGIGWGSPGLISSLVAYSPPALSFGYKPVTRAASSPQNRGILDQIPPSSCFFGLSFLPSH